MFKRFLGILILVYVAASIQAQNDCQFFSERAGNDLIRALTDEPSCFKAAELLHECRWGSSADAQFAPIVIDKCEKTFVPKLTRTERLRYREERGLCAYEFAKQEGTISISEDYVCQADIAAKFAANPGLAKTPSPRASFDCSRAATRLDHAICTDKKLGQADIVLGRAYKSLLNSLTSEDRPMLIRLQKEWLRNVSVKCKVRPKPLTSSQRDCVRSEFETRFMDLDGCGVGGPDECLRQLQPSVSPQ